MKKYLVTLVSVFIGLTAYGQEEETENQQRLNQFNKVKQNEISLDVVAGVAGLGINPRYERVLSRHAGVGIDLNIGIEDDEFDYYEKFSITPFYRQYFFSKEDYGAKGFYGEGFAKVFSFSDRTVIFSSTNSIEIVDTYTEAALGVGIGWKWVSDSGFLIDINLGVGRNLGLADEPRDDYFPEVTGRGGVNFGWRF